MTDMLEPDGGNLYRPHQFMVHSGQFWRCTHGTTGFGPWPIWKGCDACAKADPQAFARWHAPKPQPEGVFGKYIISKSDGKPLDPEACYFVLRLDTDEAARFAAMEYARRCDNRTLADDITACVTELNQPCSCRSVGDYCSRHPMFSRIWKAGRPQTEREFNDDPRSLEELARLPKAP